MLLTGLIGLSCPLNASAGSMAALVCVTIQDTFEVLYKQVLIIKFLCE